MSAHGWTTVTTPELRVGDRLKSGRRVGTITALAPGRRNTLLITLDDSTTPLVGLPATVWTVHRPADNAGARHDPAPSADPVTELIPLAIVAFGILIVLAILVVSL